MLRYFFITAHLILCGFFLYLAIMAYLNWDGTWDAGIIPLFFACWFAFAACGFYFKNIWSVSMASLALIGTALLGMFVIALGEIQKDFDISKTGADMVIYGLGLIGFVIAGELYAFWQFRHQPEGTNPD